MGSLKPAVDPAGAEPEDDRLGGVGRRPRHARQRRFPAVGDAGQARLSAARVLVVGLGATGGAVADLLARAGVGLTLVDRDYVEITNLQRQTLFALADLDQPKAEAARARLAAIDPELPLEVRIADLHAGNALALARGHALIVDGTDNFAARFVINDAALSLGIPWVYCGAIGASGAAMAFGAKGQPCLRCLHPVPPEPGSHDTCETAGVLQPAVAIVAGLAAMEALRLLLGEPAPPAALQYVDAWARAFPRLAVAARADCPSCALGQLPALRPDGDGDALATVLCGRDAVQVRPASASLDLAALATRLAAACEVELANSFIVRFRAEGLVTTVFADGRAIIQGLDDGGRARGHYARWIGL